MAAGELVVLADVHWENVDEAGTSVFSSDTVQSDVEGPPLSVKQVTWFSTFLCRFSCASSTGHGTGRRSGYYV